MKALSDKVVFFVRSLFLIFFTWANIKLFVRSIFSCVKPIGRVHILHRNAAGEVIFDGYYPNLVVNTGLSHIADQLSGKSQAQMAYMAVGTGTASVLATNTALASELDRNPLDEGYPQQGTGGETNKVLYVCTWAAGDGTGALTEAALFNSPSAGTMLCRTVYPVKNKEAGEAIVMSWALTITS